jgi:hypothetical protein
MIVDIGLIVILSVGGYVHGHFIERGGIVEGSAVAGTLFLFLRML